MRYNILLLTPPLTPSPRWGGDVSKWQKEREGRRFKQDELIHPSLQICNLEGTLNPDLQSGEYVKPYITTNLPVGTTSFHPVGHCLMFGISKGRRDESRLYVCGAKKYT